MRRREEDRVMPAHRMAYHHRRAETPSRDQRRQILNVVPRAVGPVLRPIAVAMAALIEREHVIVADEGRRRKVPPMSVRRAAVQEEQQRLALAAVVKAV